MKTRRQVWLWVVALLSMALPVSAVGIGDIRVNARFLTDRMAFELNLNSNQYDDLYEVNYDFLRNVDPYLADVARQDAYALDSYYRYLNERNDDLRWILSNGEYVRFLALDYFFRPVYVLNNLCALRVYQRYPNRDYFYYRRPVHYGSYCGAHSRSHWNGASYYERHFSRRYNHPVFGGDYRVRPEHRRHDFGPASRPSGPGAGFRFTPAQPPRPGNPSMSHRPPRVDQPRPCTDQPRPSMRPEPSRPSRDDGRWNQRPGAPKRPDAPSFNRNRKEERSARPGRQEKEDKGRNNHRRPAQSDTRFLRGL